LIVSAGGGGDAVAAAMLDAALHGGDDGPAMILTHAWDRLLIDLCEVRDAGLPVPLTDEGPTVHEADLDETLSRNELARAVLATETLAEAEQYCHRTWE